MSLPSKRYSEWHKLAWIQLPNAMVKPLEPCEVNIKYWMPDRRKRDLTNMTESIMDLLVDRGIISDDNCSVVSWVGMRNMGRDKDNPRTEIEICPSLAQLENWHTD